MRLLNVWTLELKEFEDDAQRPPYAITSHRWYSLEEEVTYQEWLQPTVEIEKKPGYAKVVGFCEIVRVRLAKSAISWIWIDTCCIDKKSSAELQEAVNSMFRWYQEAAFCLAFLSDVAASPDNVLDTLEHSEWFQRGWTLQELLAPALVLFLDQKWQAFGHKAPDLPLILDVPLEDVSLATPAINTQLATITGISRAVLADYAQAEDISVEAKQRWMHNRRTTRVEDWAYCQFGIFGVFLPLLYGEGKRAAKRLRKEIREMEREKRLAPGQDDDVTTNDTAPIMSAGKTEVANLGFAVKDLRKDMAVARRKDNNSVANTSGSSATKEEVEALAKALNDLQRELLNIKIKGKMPTSEASDSGWLRAEVDTLKRIVHELSQEVRFIMDRTAERYGAGILEHERSSRRPLTTTPRTAERRSSPSRAYIAPLTSVYTNRSANYSPTRGAMLPQPVAFHSHRPSQKTNTVASIPGSDDDDDSDDEDDVPYDGAQRARQSRDMALSIPQAYERMIASGSAHDEAIKALAEVWKSQRPGHSQRLAAAQVSRMIEDESFRRQSKEMETYTADKATCTPRPYASVPLMPRSATRFPVTPTDAWSAAAYQLDEDPRALGGSLDIAKTLNSM